MIKDALVGCTLHITWEELLRNWNWIQKLGGTVVIDKINWTHVPILRQHSIDGTTGYSCHILPSYPWSLWYRSSLWRWLSFKTDVKYSCWITWVVSAEFDEELVGKSSVGSFCRRVTSVRVVVLVLLARGCLVPMGALLVGLEMFQSRRNWTHNSV